MCVGPSRRTRLFTPKTQNITILVLYDYSRRDLCDSLYGTDITSPIVRSMSDLRDSSKNSYK